ncbi:MAG: nuclear transport factor 2 family protein [Pseudomonadota bacterium]
MKPHTRQRLAFAAALFAITVTTAGIAGDPVVTDARIINEDRRLAILETKLSSLQQQVSLLEDVKALERLQQAYGYYVSEGMAHDAAALFSSSPAASIEYAQQGVFRGIERIEAFLTKSGARLNDGEIRETPIMQAVVHVAADGRTAKARWRSLVMGGMRGEDGTWTEGPYENEYVKEDGIWKIGKLHWYTSIAGSYDLGWHRKALPAAGVLKDLPPDLPPSEKYESFPTFFLPPYHYFNPVTGKPVAWETVK